LLITDDTRRAMLAVHLLECVPEELMIPCSHKSLARCCHHASRTIMITVPAICTRRSSSGTLRTNTSASASVPVKYITEQQFHWQRSQLLLAAD
jgi:hypothetical protein